MAGQKRTINEIDVDDGTLHPASSSTVARNPSPRMPKQRRLLSKVDHVVTSQAGPREETVLQQPQDSTNDKNFVDASLSKEETNDKVPTKKARRSRAPRAETDRVNGRFYYCEPGSEARHEAVTHDSIRAELIASKQPHDDRGFVYKPTKGLGPHDETSYEPSQKYWGPDRANRPDVLFEFDPPDADAKVSRTSAKPGWMMYGGKVVLDHNDMPLVDWPNLNATLSASVEPFRLEALFRIFTKAYKSFQQEDLRARSKSS